MCSSDLILEELADSLDESVRFAHGDGRAIHGRRVVCGWRRRIYGRFSPSAGDGINIDGAGRVATRADEQLQRGLGNICREAVTTLIET